MGFFIDRNNIIFGIESGKAKSMGIGSKASKSIGAKSNSSKKKIHQIVGVSSFEDSGASKIQNSRIYSNLQNNNSSIFSNSSNAQVGESKTVFSDTLRKIKSM